MVPAPALLFIGFVFENKVLTLSVSISRFGKWG